MGISSESPNKAEFSQTAIAEKMGLHGNSRISEWENGKLPDPEQLENLITVLELDKEDGNYLYNLAYGRDKGLLFSDDEIEQFRKTFRDNYYNFPSIAYLLDNLWYLLDANPVVRSKAGTLPTEGNIDPHTNILEVILNPFSTVIHALGPETLEYMIPKMLAGFRQDTTYLRFTERYMRLIYRLAYEVPQSNLLRYWNEDFKSTERLYTGTELIINGLDHRMVVEDKVHRNLMFTSTVYFAPLRPSKNEQIKVFVSYKHEKPDMVEDKIIIDNLLDYIRPGIMKDGVDFWIDEVEIKIGDEWHHKIVENLEEADIFLALVSERYLHASPYISDEEVKRALQKRREKGLVIFPVIVSPCDWESINWLKHTEFRPKHKTLSHYKNPEDKEQFLEIKRHMQHVISEIRMSRP